MWKLGNIEIESHVILAPMAGITSEGYRRYLSNFGIGLVYSEMVSDMGLIYGNDETSTYIDFKPLNIPTGVQLFGHDPECLRKATVICLSKNPNIAFFDVNMGCPVNKVIKSGAGSALMKDPKLCGDIIKAIKSVTDKPVTAKIRLGFNEINYIDVIHELENAGVSAIAIHARTRKEMYMGEPHFDLLKDLRKQMKVPLIISGNVFSLDYAIEMMKLTGADAVMVARGSMGNPYLCKQIDTYIKTGERLETPSLDEQIKYCKELADCLIEEKGEEKAMRIYRAIAPKFFVGFPNCKEIKNKLSTLLMTRKSLDKIIDEYLKSQIFD